jgi:hypothetical protein
MTMRRLATPLALGLAAGLAGGCAYSNVKRDIDRQPIVHTGVGATILLPGQSAPALPIPQRGVGQRGAPSPVYAPPPGAGNTSGSYSGSGTGTGTGSGSGSGYAAAPGTSQGYGGGSYGAPAPGAPPVGSGGNIHFIGGAEIDEVTHTELHQDPLLLKGLFAPVALVAWPFRKAYEVLQGDPQPVAAPPPATAPPRGPIDYEAAYEQSQLERLEQQVGAPAPRRSAPGGPPAPGGAAPAERPRSIADELAALQRRVPPRGVAAETAPGAEPGTATPSGVADKVSDRNGDGRPDVWQYREGGVLVRELFDEDGDGRVDRTVRYDPAGGEKVYEEEDANVDGLVDSWVDYRGGEVLRRRQDVNADGQPDSWTLYRAGKLARVEEDRNGDGFRDRVGYYREGRMQREVEDANGDGRPDRVTLYDETERARERSEDLDGDGLVDARSFFENGKLVRRELVDESLGQQPLVEEEQLGTPGGFSDGSEGGPAPDAATGDEG